MHAQRYSFQREKIYQAVCASREHPTAEMVYTWLKGELPRLSLGTVYRNLHQMAEEGRIREMPGPVARFDADTALHSHFTCDKCGAVVDVALPYDSGADVQARQAGFQIDRHATMFYGVCPACLEAGRRERS